MAIDLSLAPAPDAALPAGGAHFLAALARSRHEREPFDHWLLDHVLPPAMIHDLAGLPFPAPVGGVFDGRRESNNSTRVYFSPAVQQAYRVCGDVANLFASDAVIAALSAEVGRNLSAGRLRIEYCQDVDGFWLEPHLDISVKLFTFLIYLSDDPNLADAGTDIYDNSPEHRLVGSAPYGANLGLIFVPGHNTWHGLGRRPIRGLRKSLIINYVSPDWRHVEELARP